MQDLGLEPLPPRFALLLYIHAYMYSKYGVVLVSGGSSESSPLFTFPRCSVLDEFNLLFFFFYFFLFSFFPVNFFFFFLLLKR